ncbi:hypothetical protein PROFUN_15293 [Planoprotostelium fungivorum]|uniref:Uncharacterized protein n=1 Tax=Planoprotostelium fungivorum TaxID=1890364 RepID=A0A2P6MMA6_9EUKA|nr:hypothetical protein PROFUN_15293 [Planoprotostelium fungivorum]
MAISEVIIFHSFLLHSLCLAAFCCWTPARMQGVTHSLKYPFLLVGISLRMRSTSSHLGRRKILGTKQSMELFELDLNLVRIWRKGEQFT